MGDNLIAKCGDTIVGQRLWSGEYTDIPAMGDDGFDLTEGYCTAGEFPSFEIIKENGISYKLKGEYPACSPNANNVIQSLHAQMICTHLNFQ